MKAYFGVGLGMLAGTVLGAAAVSGLHAQSKSPVYVVAEIAVTNPQAYGKEYAPLAQASIKKAGGRLIALGGGGGAGAKKLTVLEGSPPKRAVIQEWDSLEQVQAWYKGADYQAARKIGDKYAKFRLFVLDSK